MTTDNMILESMDGWYLNEGILTENFAETIMAKLKNVSSFKKAISIMEPLADMNKSNDELANEASSSFKKNAIELANKRNISKAEVSTAFMMILKALRNLPAIVVTILVPISWLLVWICALSVNVPFMDAIKRYVAFLVDQIKYKWSSDLVKFLWFTFALSVMGTLLRQSILVVPAFAAVVIPILLIKNIYVLILSVRLTRDIIKNYEKPEDINNWKIDLSVFGSDGLPNDKTKKAFQ